jgi:hypothetical protein
LNRRYGRSRQYFLPAHGQVESTDVVYGV